MKKLSILIFICFLTLNTKAQIQEEIINYTDSTEVLIQNGRQLLTQNLRYSDIEKAQEIYQFLNSVTKDLDTNTHAFYFNEELALHFLFQEWDNFLITAASHNTTDEWFCYSCTNGILFNILDAIGANSAIIEFGMASSNLSNEDADIIQLYYYLVKSREADELYGQKYKAFKETYTHSKYNNFINQYLIKPKIKAHWSFSAGPNYIYPNLEIKEHFEPNMGVTFDFSFNFNRLLFSLYFSNASLHSKYAYSVYDNSHHFDFNDHEAFIYNEVGGLFGYSVLYNKHFRISPFIPLAVTSIQSNHFKGDEKKNEYKVFKSFTSGIGLNSEVKLWQFRLRDKYTDMKSFLSLKIQMGFNTIFDTTNRNVFYIRTGIVWGFGDF